MTGKKPTWLEVAKNGRAVLTRKQKWSLEMSGPYLRRGAGGGKREAVPCGPVEPDTSVDIKSVDGFVFFRLSYFDYSDLQLFTIFIFEIDFSETYLMTSAENNVSEPPNLKILTPLQSSCHRHSR